MTWTSAFGRACGWLLNKIVHGLALTRISPNVLTFIGLVINIVAAFLFGHANAANADWMFFYAGMVIFGAGLFDMVDGRVARRNNKVTVFGSFFDSVIDRYSDVVLFFGLLVYYGRINRFPLRGAGGLRHGDLADGQLHARPRRGPHRPVQGRLHGAPGAHRAHHHRRPVQPLGRNGPVLWVLAVLSTITVAHRIVYTYQNTKQMTPPS
jgi:CDP-diacylglycerol--glycerol-3-phosphate 3-phosphatidyltransferase